MIKRSLVAFAGIGWFICHALSTPLLDFRNPRGAFEAGIGRFKVDVIALRDGRPARDLTLSDFELFEDGRKVPLSSVSFIPADSRKHLTVIFHDMNLWIKNVQRDKDDITEELIALSRLGISLTLMRLDSPGGLRIIQPATRDEVLIRSASALALEKAGMSESYDTLGMKPMEFEGMEALVNKEARGQLLSFYYAKRLRFEKTVGGLMAACFSLLDIPGRKSILLISGGIPDISSASRSVISQSSVETGRTSGVEAQRETLDAVHERSRQTQSRSRLFDPFGLLRGEKFERGDQVLKSLVRFANTLNISIYSLDPGVFSRNVFTLAPEFVRPEQGGTSDSILNESRSSEVQNLREVSEGTGGQLFRGANKFADLQRTLTSDLEGYYELDYRAVRKNPDGKPHRIAVRTARKDVDLRFRNGYLDLTSEDAKNMLLVSAYYSPELFSGVPFQGLFVPVVEGSGKIVSWIHLALPVGPVFLDSRRADSPKTTFTLNVWLRGHEEAQRGFAAAIDIPFAMTDSLRASLPHLSRLRTHFKGPEMTPRKAAYDAVLVLQDSETGDLGGWSSPVLIPDLRAQDREAVIGCVMGIADEPSGDRVSKETVVIDPKSGILEFGRIRFFPLIDNRITPGQDAWVFIQAYLPFRKEGDFPKPRFEAFGRDADSVAGEIGVDIASEHWNKRARVWSAVCRIRMGMLAGGRYVLKIVLPASPGSGGPDLMSEIRFEKGG